MTHITSPRLIDHLVLPVAEIDDARERYSALGFTVAPNGLHPFGTENCCIFFRDGTFLEPLGIAQRETCEEKALKGNTFVANDQTYRFRRGLEGFSHVVLKTDDAKADHKLFGKAGILGGKMVRFSRAFQTPDGEKGRVAFHLAFASDQRSPDSPFFSCEVLNAPKVDRSALQTHDNGVMGLKEILISEPNPTDFQYMLQTLLNQREMDANSFGMSFHTGNCDVSVLSPEGLAGLFGVHVNRSSDDNERGMRFEAFVLAVSSLETLRAHLDAKGVEYSTHNGRVVVPPAPGQGMPILFEETN
ncbi:MAG: VOC family protein [Pseudomonadota bacterium]